MHPSSILGEASIHFLKDINAIEANQRHFRAFSRVASRCSEFPWFPGIFIGYRLLGATWVTAAIMVRLAQRILRITRMLLPFCWVVAIGSRAQPFVRYGTRRNVSSASLFRIRFPRSETNKENRHG